VTAEPPLGERLGQGREAEIFAWGDGTVLRLMRDPEHGWRLDREAVAVAAAAQAGAPVPGAHERLIVSGRPGLVMERIDGPDLLTLLARQPWRIFATGRMLGEVHARLHEASAPSELPRVGVEARERIEAGADRLPGQLAHLALAVLRELPDGSALCHGDFNPANVLLSSSGPRVIDWVAAGAGDPHADVARARLLLTIGEPQPGAPAVIKRLDRLGRPLLLGGYMRAYLRKRKIDPQRLAQWEVVRAAERLAFEFIPEEERSLRSLLERRLLAGNP
jgi:aminoglycoside phosphotransferase (APT) family kinase protein